MTSLLPWTTILSLFWLVSIQLYACDFCTLYTGVLPQDRLNRLEYYQRYSRFSRTLSGIQNGKSASQAHARTAHVPAGSDFNTSNVKSYESYIFHDLRYSFFVGPKWQFSAGIPYQIFKENIDGETSRSKNGFGDATVFALHGIVVQEALKKSIRWFAGAGLRLPTGWYYRNEQMYTNHFFEQGGTGTMGYVIISSLNFRNKNWGITQMLNARYHPATSRSYKPGAVVNLSHHFFVMVNLRYPDIRLLPSIALYAEAFDGNRNFGYKVMNTGGFASFVGPDVSIYFNRLNLRVAWTMPLVEHLNGAPFQSENRIQIGIMYTFGKQPC